MPLNQTMTILALSESNEKIKDETPLKDEDCGSKNSTIKALSHLINITTKELEEQRNKAIEASKIKDVFLANMSHELKTPLNSINIISSVMLKNKQQNLNEQQIKNLSIINKSGHFLLHMINDVLDISKLESKNMDINIDKLNLTHIVNEIIDMFKPQFKEKGIYLISELDKNLDFIYSDEIRIKQILKNLISNSLKFTDKGYVKIFVSNNDSNINIEVEDQGIGIEKEKLEYIFDRFKQADDTTTKRYGGTGLGLAITKELVKLLNGNISINSTLNVGTKILISLPKNLDFVKHLNNIEISNNKNDDLKENIIVLNNEPIYFFDLIMKLQKEFNVIQVASKEQLISQYKGDL